MNKRANTLLFILGATLANILITIVSFLILTFFYARFIMPLLPEEGYVWGFTFIFIISIVIAFFVYRVVLKHLLKRIDVEKYFDPLLAGRYKKK